MTLRKLLIHVLRKSDGRWWFSVSRSRNHPKQLVDGKYKHLEDILICYQTSKKGNFEDTRHFWSEFEMSFFHKVAG